MLTSLTSSRSPRQPCTGEAPEGGGVSVDQARGPASGRRTCLGPEQRLQDRRASQRELRTEVRAHRGASRRRDGRHTSSYCAAADFPTQYSCSGAGRRRYEEVLATGLQLPVAASLLLLKKLTLVGAASGLRRGHASDPDPRLLAEEGVGGHVAG